MQTAKLPASVTESLDRTNRDFLCGKNGDQRKIHLMAWNIVCIPKSVVDLVLNKWSRWMRPSWRRQPGAYLKIHKLCGQMFVIWNIKQVVLVQINYRMGLIHGEVYRRVRNSSLRVELGFVNPTVTGRGKVTTDESFSSCWRIWYKIFL